MWTVYFQFGFHSIRHFADKEFEEVKEFYHLFEVEDGKYTNNRRDIYAWKDSEV